MRKDKIYARNDEIEVLRTGEVADARMGDVGGLVRRDDVVPYAHLQASKDPEADGSFLLLIRLLDRRTRIQAASLTLLRPSPLSLYTPLSLALTV